MNTESAINIVSAYIDAYNNLDVEAMLEQLHPDIEFENITNNQRTHKTKGKDSFRDLALYGISIIKHRRQQITKTEPTNLGIKVHIKYTAVMKEETNGTSKQSKIVTADGISEFTFQEGKIISIRDIS